ncbi:hypothetical protein K492DRAFT_183731 [Lichtheimia hyalospora FSU 10163]|nr:hypothetical protein K492DRAFT_183731 [Lichtheimia hyalospora FSU 10163]
MIPIAGVKCKSISSLPGFCKNKCNPSHPSARYIAAQVVDQKFLFCLVWCFIYPTFATLVYKVIVKFVPGCPWYDTRKDYCDDMMVICYGCFGVTVMITATICCGTRSDCCDDMLAILRFGNYGLSSNTIGKALYARVFVQEGLGDSVVYNDKNAVECFQT